MSTRKLRRNQKKNHWKALRQEFLMRDCGAPNCKARVRIGNACQLCGERFWSCRRHHLVVVHQIREHLQEKHPEEYAEAKEAWDAEQIK